MLPESARGRSLAFFLSILFFLSANAADALAAGVAVRGKVLAAPGDQPVAGAKVILTPASGEKASQAQTNNKGLFRFPDVKTGIYSVQAVAPGYISRLPERISIGPGGGPEGLTVRLNRPSAVSGTVTDEKGNPVPGAKVSASWGMKPFAVTASDGTFRLTGLAPGTIFLNVRALGFARHQQSGIETTAGGETGGVSIALRPGGSISGRVIHRESGKPLARVQVSVSGPAYDSMQTNAAGRFRIDHLPPGAYAVNVHKEGFEWTGTGNVQVEPGRSVEVQTLAMSLRPPALDLHVSENVFTTREEAAIRVRVFRVPRIEFALREVPIADYLAALQEGAASRTLDPARFKIVRTWESHPRYKRPYQEVYGRMEKIGKMSAGAYLLTARAEGIPVRQALILATDLAVFVKSSPDETLLYASSFRTTRPAAGAEVSFEEFVSAASPAAIGSHAPRRIVQSGRTDESGLFRLQKTPAEAAWRRAFVRLGKDLAVVRIPLGYRAGKTKAYVYTDRPVYRPGQEVFFKGIVREERGDSYVVLPGQRVQMDVRDAAGNLMTTQNLVTNERGAFDGKLALADEPPLGDYRITTRVGQDLHESTFRVLEYRKPEYRVIVKPSAPRVVGGQTLTVQAEARYYFGAPVAGAKISWHIYETPRWEYDDDLSAEDASFYDVSPDDEDRGYGRHVKSGEGVTDAQGLVSFEVATNPLTTRDSTLRVEVRVTDLSRREVVGRAGVLTTRGNFKVSLALDRWVYAPGEEARLRITAADYEGKPVQTHFTLTLKREIWTKKKAVTEVAATREGKTDADGRATISVAPAKAGYYRVYLQAVDPGGRVIASERWLWVSGEDASFAYRYGEIRLVADKKIYKPGDTARVLVNVARPGSDALLTLEGSRIHEAKVVRLASASTLVEIPIGRDHVPTLHLSVTLAPDKKLASHTLALPVRADERFLSVEVKAEKQDYRPREQSRWIVKTTDSSGKPVPAEVSVGVVDAAIYAISPELVPDIRKFFYGPKPNRVFTAHSFPRLYDAAAAKDKRDEEIRRDFRDTAFWAPAVLTGADGTAAVEFPFPDNLTTWRATARAHTPETHVGQATGETLTKKPVIARLEMPRFLVEGDRSTLTGVIHNHTKAKLKFAAELRLDGIAVVGESRREVEIESRGVARLDWPVRASRPGTFRVTLAARSDGGSDGMELPLPVLPHGISRLVATAGDVKERAEIPVALPPDAAPHTAEFTVTISPSLSAAIFSALDALAAFPYGCTEQTLSAFLPDVMIERAIEKVGTAWLPEGRYAKLKADLPKMVKKGLGKLYALQHADGGWGWWENDLSHPYLTSYAVMGIAQSKRAGHAVDESRLQRGIGALRTLYGRSNDANEKVYIYHALLSAGFRDNAMLAYLSGERLHFTPYTKAIFALALVEHGKPAEAADLVEELFRSARETPSAVHWESQRPGSWSWIDNDVEATAYALRAVLAVRPDDPRVAKIVRWLVGKRIGREWASTKETAAVLYALTDLIIHTKELAPDYRATVGWNGNALFDERISRVDIGREKKSAQGRLEANRLEIKAPAGSVGRENRLEIVKRGTGSLYYGTALTYVTSGEPIQPFASGFKVARTYHRVVQEMDDRGEWRRKAIPLEGPVKSGEEVEVRLRMTADDRYQYIIVEDPLPAGFEVVDRPDAPGPWRWWYARREVRDRKIVFFATLWSQKTYEASYTVRAETPGDVHVLPTKVSSMYFPEVNGTGPEGRIEIKP
mgnify:CR=1 FL=1